MNPVCFWVLLLSHRRLRYKVLGRHDVWGWGCHWHRQPKTNCGYGNVRGRFSEYGSGARSPRSSGLEPIPGHSSYRVMVLYAFVGPRGPGVSIAARRTPCIGVT